MFPTTLQRAIFRELLLVFITALFVCVALLIVADMFDDRWKNCVGAASVVFVIQWLVLAMLPEAVPTALLLPRARSMAGCRDMEGKRCRRAAFTSMSPAALGWVAFSLGTSGCRAPRPSSCPQAVIQQGEALIHAKLRSSGMVKIDRTSSMPAA